MKLRKIFIPKWKKCRNVGYGSFRIRLFFRLFGRKITSYTDNGGKIICYEIPGFGDSCRGIYKRNYK